MHKLHTNYGKIWTNQLFNCNSSDFFYTGPHLNITLNNVSREGLIDFLSSKTESAEFNLF